MIDNLLSQIAEVIGNNMMIELESHESGVIETRS